MKCTWALRKRGVGEKFLYNFSGAKSEEKGLHWRSRHRWEVNIQQIATETRENLDWI